MGRIPLSRAHEKIRTCATQGVIADFTTEDDPAALPPYDDEEFWNGRTVDGEWLAAFVADVGASVHYRGVEVHGVRVLDEIDLRAADIRAPWTLERCQLGSLQVILSESKCRSIALVDIAFGGLEANDAEVFGSLFIKRCKASGLVQLMGASIGGDLDCSGSTFLNLVDDALNAERAHIGESVFFRENFRATGSVTLSGVHVGGSVHCSGASFSSPGKTALSFDGARIDGNVKLTEGFTASGGVVLQGSRIGGDLDCSGASIRNTLGYALIADGVGVTGGVILQEGFSVKGIVCLDDLSASALFDDEASWPEQITLDGFRYDRLYTKARDWRARARWLRRQVDPSPYGYIHLASVYRSRGDERDARKILIERHDTLLHPPEHWKQHLPTGLRGFFTKGWRWFLRLTIGHGYAPWRALYFAIPLVAAMAVWYADARNDNLLIPTGNLPAASSRCTSTYVCVQPVVYALDTLLPLVDFGQRAKWTPDQSKHGDTWLADGRWLAGFTWFTSALGWVLATLVAAGFTQAVRRE